MSSAVSRALPRLAIALVLLGILLWGVFPTSDFLEQRDATEAAQNDLEALDQENAELEDRLAALETDAEIERLARERFQLVYPGEEPFAVLPPPPQPVVIPDAWPFTSLVD